MPIQKSSNPNVSRFTMYCGPALFGKILYVVCHNRGSNATGKAVNSDLKPEFPDSFPNSIDYCVTTLHGNHIAV